ncbi:MAG: hypothetical protein RLZZ436_54 [Planctomycetota bacterium]|jgi:DNA-directed RNA polymerase specialized sigma24 family protein
MATDNSDSFDPRAASRFDQLSGTHKTHVRISISPPIPQPPSDLSPEQQREMEEARQLQRRAREREIQRYQPASTAYLNAMLKNADRAAAVWESVIDKWLAGKLNNYDPAQSFRLYLKAVLRNEVFTFSRKRRQQAERTVLQLDEEYDAAGSLENSASEAFDKKLRDDLIERTLSAIRMDNALHYEVIRLLMTAAATGSAQPASKELAEYLSRESGNSVSEESARQIKFRARERFPRELIRQVQLLIQSDDLDRVEETLSDLGLLEFCEKTLRKMREDRGGTAGRVS